VKDGGTQASVAEKKKKKKKPPINGHQWVYPGGCWELPHGLVPERGETMERVNGGV